LGGLRKGGKKKDRLRKKNKKELESPSDRLRVKKSAPEELAGKKNGKKTDSKKRGQATFHSPGKGREKKRVWA